MPNFSISPGKFSPLVKNDCRIIEFSLMSHSASLRQGKEEFLSSCQSKLPYLVYRPPGYAKSRKKWPLLLFLHGAGERGDDLSLVARHGPPRLIAQGRDFPFFVVSPQCCSGGNWVTRDLKALLDFLLREYRIDPRRVYLTGLSMGGFGTWSMASEYPELFAAVAPICGGGDYIRSHLLPESRKAMLRSLPVRVFHGDQDAAVPVSESVRMAGIFREIGNTNVELTVYPGVGHDSWTRTYSDPDFFDWFLKRRRPSSPAR